MYEVLADALGSVERPFKDISSILDRTIPIAEWAATRADEAKREVSRARLKDGGPESLNVAIQSVPIIAENLRSIRDYIAWYNTLWVRLSRCFSPSLDIFFPAQDPGPSADSGLGRSPLRTTVLGDILP